MKFSVLMPVYIKENPASLKQALVSITVNQSHKPDEIVIVEDGPITEELEMLLSSFEKDWPVIRRYRLKENQGMGKAMNFGLGCATHEWIARMDSDDIARPERFAMQVAYLDSHKEIDVLGSSIEEFDEVPGDKGIKRTLPLEHEGIMKLMRMRNPINHMTVFYRRELAVRAGGYWDERYFEDYNLWYEMSKAGARLHNLPHNLVDVRVGNNMVGRRSGLSYFHYEKLLLRKFLKDGFISRTSYCALLVIKATLRILPVSLLKLVYRLFLRKSL